MKKTAILYFLWPKNLSILDHYLSSRNRVVVVLNDYVTVEMQEIIRSRGSELVVLESLLSESEYQVILEKSDKTVKFLSNNLEINWVKYLDFFGIQSQDFNLTLAKISKNYLAICFKILACLKKLKAEFFVESIVVNEEWLISGRCAVSWAKTHNIPCLHVLHAAIINRYYMVHNRVASDVFAVYGEREINNLTNIGVSKQQICITGNPAWDQYPFLRTQRQNIRKFIFQKYGLDKDLPLVVFGTIWDYYGTAIYDKEDIDFESYGVYGRTLYVFFKACNDLLAAGKPANFLIKDRPANESFDSLSLIKELAIKSDFPEDSFYYATEDTKELVIAADVVISVGSNLSVEALIAGTPAINLLNDQLLRLGPNFDAYSGILEVEPSQLSSAIFSILQNRPFREKLLQLMRNKVNYYNIDDGKASIRVAELMAEIALDRFQFDYQQWFESRPFFKSTNKYQLTPLSNQLTFHLIATVKHTQYDLLIKTLISLQTQYCSYWILTIISDSEPDTDFALSNRTFWKTVDTLDLLTIAEVVNSIVQEGTADWFGLLPVGLRFDPSSLWVIAAHINLNPGWSLIYTDSDYIDDQARNCEPQFRPDFNYDLLLSRFYIGDFCLIKRGTLLNVGGFGNCYGAENYELILKIFDSFGEAAIGHIADITYHIPIELKTLSIEEPRRNAVLAHLARRGIHADILEGYQPATFFIDYHHTIQPPISIIIHLQSNNECIKSCIGSILGNTTYFNYEIFLINDHNCDRSELEAFLNELGLYEKILLINNPKKHTSPSTINFAAKLAKGDYLLLLSDELRIVQENWLNRLLAYALRQDVGVVGCRLILPDQQVRGTGVILGKQDGVACPVQYSDPQDAGYMGRGLVAQNFSAITADCMLIRKNLFFKADGLNEKDFSQFYYDLDLCLKIKKQGYRIVWTPYTALFSANNSSQPKSIADEELRSRRLFIKRWRDYFANDPAYNRNLSLRQKEWMIDGDFGVPWHPNLEPLPRIVAQAPDEMGVGQYRVIGPIKALTQSEQICSFMLPALNSDKPFLPSISELVRAKPTALFLQNAFTEFHLKHLEDYAELLPDIFRVFGQDDIVFSVPQKSSARKHFGKDTKTRVRRAVSLCHRVIATTEPIAEALRGMNDDIRVVPNYLEPSRWEGLQPPKNERRKPRVGWAGAQQHDGDLEFILPVVEATANEVDWIFMGMCPPKLRYHVVETHPAVPFDQYPAALAALDLDLAIAPLELNRFNAAKSNLRLLEYGAVGYPVIATDILPYQGAPATRVPNNPQAWIKAIREHIHELEATRAAGERLRQWVLSDWMLDQHLDEWLRALLPD